jgi:hypothetical protein
MNHLVDTPRLFGWDWDEAMVDGGGYGNTNPILTDEAFKADPDIEAWSGAFYGSDTIDGVHVPLLGMGSGSTVTPPIRSGRMIRGEGEIVLGTETVRQLGKRLGEQVAATSGPLTIVGTATLPSIGIVHGAHTSLGVGGIVAPDNVPGWDRNATASGNGTEPAPPEYGPNVLFVRFRPGVDRGAAASRLAGTADKIADYNGAVVTPPQRSAEIVNTRSITSSSTLLGVATAGAALASLTVALGAVVLRRRKDLGVLKTIGFTRRQIGATVAWQASTTVLIAVLLGVPLGTVLGRVLWVRFADSLQVVAAPVTPLLDILFIGVAALLAGNVIAVLPARLARRVPAKAAILAE